MSPRPQAQKPEIQKRIQHGKEETLQTHPAYAIASISRITGSPRQMFQSDVLHRDTVVLKINRAELTRSMNRDSTYTRNQIVEVEMSLSQWGSLIASAGIGSGVPVTLRQIAGEGEIPDITPESRIEQNVTDVLDSVQNLIEKISEAFNEADHAINDKQGIRSIREKMNNLRYEIKNAPGNSAYAVKQLHEAAEKVIVNVKSDIEAHMLQAQYIAENKQTINQSVIPEFNNLKTAISTKSNEHD